MLLSLTSVFTPRGYTGPGPPGPEPNITRTRGACAHGPYKRAVECPGRHTREIARAPALAAYLTPRGRPSAPATSPRSHAEQLHPRTPRTRAIVDLRAAEQRCGMVSGHYVEGVWAGIGHIRGFESALHTVERPPWRPLTPSRCRPVGPAPQRAGRRIPGCQPTHMMSGQAAV